MQRSDAAEPRLCSRLNLPARPQVATAHRRNGGPQDKCWRWWRSAD